MKQRSWPWPLLVLLMAACGSSSENGADGGGSDDPDSSVGSDPDATPDPTITAGPAEDMLTIADPKLEGFDGWPLRFAVDPAGFPDVTCQIEVTKSGTLFQSGAAEPVDGICSAMWDGRDQSGNALSPGPLTVTITVRSGASIQVEQDVMLEVVRVGISEIAVEETTPMTRAPLLYGETDGMAEGFWEIPADRAIWRIAPDGSEGPGAVSLEYGDGSPRELPPIWADLKSPPLDPASPDGIEQDTFSMPTAWVAGSRPDFLVTFSADSSGNPGGGEPDTGTVRIVPPVELTPQAIPMFDHDTTYRFETFSSPVPTVARHDHGFVWGFEQWNGQSWVRMPGRVTTWVRMYGVVAMPVFASTTLPHRPWVEVVDTVVGWIDGQTTDPNVAAGIIVERVYDSMNLTYDEVNGASAYTIYPNFDWSGAIFDIVQFQRRGYGDIINCSDAASIVGAYANMIGIDIRYHILQRPDGFGFDLNYIQPIGFMGFTETPFTDGDGDFNYHAVAGPPSGTIYDATLALDGDGTPTSLPATPLLAEGMAAMDYLMALSSEWGIIDMYEDDRVRLQ